MIGGLGMIGAIQINKAPVTLDQVMPLALLTGEYQPLVVAADSPIKSLQDLIAKFKADPARSPGAGSRSAAPTTSCRVWLSRPRAATSAR